MDRSSNEIWVNSDNYDDFELSRPQLFREDMRGMFFYWFGIGPRDRVLDGGCGPGVLTRYIAKGQDGGFVTGFDLSQNFVEYGNAKIKEEGLSEKAAIVREDGFALSFEDNTFDVVVNHNYLGVLSDPMAGLKEMIRVCRPGGRVSASYGAGRIPGDRFYWRGDYPLDGLDRLRELTDRYNAVYDRVITRSVLKQNAYWTEKRYPKLFTLCGLKDIRLFPCAWTFSYSDGYWQREYKIKKIKREIDREIEIFKENGKLPQFAEYGFSGADFDEMIGLLRKKQAYLLENLDSDESWEWTANLNFIVSGTK